MSFDENELRQMGFTLDRHGDWANTVSDEITVVCDLRTLAVWVKNDLEESFIEFHGVKTSADLRELIRLLGTP